MKTKRPEQKEKSWFYAEFLRELGVSTPELQELFAQEVLNLSHEEMLVIKEGSFYAPDTWTTEQERIYRKMLARAAVKAKR